MRKPHTLIQDLIRPDIRETSNPAIPPFVRISF